MLKLTILFKDHTKIEKRQITRVSNLSTNATNDKLYYETIYDMCGKGTCVEYSNILCFEVTQQ